VRCNFIILLTLLLWPFFVMATGDSHKFNVNIDTSDVNSLQRGARIFVNYCMGCHSATYMRYNRLGKDLGISASVLKQNFMFGTDKPGNTMEVSIKKDDAIKFFGVAPPDLSVNARSRGPEWLYSYFMTFYSDPSRPFGVNNLTFKDTAMPHVLWNLQGIQKPVYETITQKDGTDIDVIVRLEDDVTGELSPKEYERTVNDLVNFMVYLAEPAKLKRQKIGFWVILYLLIFLVIAYKLKKEFWKDIH